MCYYTQYKCTFVHNVRINNVPKQCVRLLYTYNLNIEENEVGPDSRQVPLSLIQLQAGTTRTNCGYKLILLEQNLFTLFHFIDLLIRT